MSARLLLIDDDPLFRSLLTAAVDGEFDVTAAAEGSQGYYAAIHRPHDIAVVDVQMPGWDGLKTISMLKANPLTAKTPVVILSSEASKSTIVEAIRLGAKDYVLKTGFSKAEFLAKVRKHVAGEHAVSRAEAPAAVAAAAPVSAAVADALDTDNWE